MNKGIIFSILMLCFIPYSTYAKPYTVDYQKSHIAFQGIHAGNQFVGAFESWTADINFDVNQLEKSKVKIVFDLEKARTMNAMYDGTLPQGDWFDVKNTPQAEFRSTSLSKLADGSFKVIGDLMLRGITRTIEFPFTLNHLNDQHVEMKAEFNIDRLSYQIGMKSDPQAEWVDKDILITILLKAAVISE